MPEFGDLKGAKVTLREEKTGELLAETKVLDYERQKRVIVVDGRGFSGEDSVRVAMLIISSRHMIECSGIARPMAGRDRWEIPLYHVQVKENRSSHRYAVTAPAKVLDLSLSGRLIPLDEPLIVTILNVSTGGVLIRTADSNLVVGSSFRIALTINGRETIVRSKVVRELTGEKGERQLGCTFLALED